MHVWQPENFFLKKRVNKLQQKKALIVQRRGGRLVRWDDYFEAVRSSLHIVLP